ncbi:nitrogenase protein alpha chain [Striga asiatica]|uniref:Nitrogenase protein alpha chain n=1 Tax=Striga asiatica TaxID=4170 RepID=A0A5A7QIN0_STRAF|nr:nitrogenase protein alpha chain [Striga asiatica]
MSFSNNIRHQHSQGRRRRGQAHRHLRQPRLLPFLDLESRRPIPYDVRLRLLSRSAVGIVQFRQRWGHRGLIYPGGLRFGCRIGSRRDLGAVGSVFDFGHGDVEDAVDECGLDRLGVVGVGRGDYFFVEPGFQRRSRRTFSGDFEDAEAADLYSELFFFETLEKEQKGRYISKV